MYINKTYIYIYIAIKVYSSRGGLVRIVQVLQVYISLYTYIYIYIYIYILCICIYVCVCSLGARYYTPEIAKVQIRWRMPLTIHDGF